MTTSDSRVIGMVGLGRMGASMMSRLRNDGHTVIGYDRDPTHRDVDSLEGLVQGIGAPGRRVVWVMLPIETVGMTIRALTRLLVAGDIIVDGGNSNYRQTIGRAKMLRGHGIRFVDCGTSGGVWGLERGYCLMIGGDYKAVQFLTPVFRSLAPGIGAASRTPGRSGPATPEEEGWLHCGPSGAGQFVKMMHNGIEYGMMAALAEGLNVLSYAGEGLAEAPDLAEGADPEHYAFEFEVSKISELWRRGSVIPSWLLDLTASALHEDPRLESYGDVVPDGGEGRWTVIAASELGVPVPAIYAALADRHGSQGRAGFSRRVLQAMRQGFGSHPRKVAER